jgi:hypothetical protein
VRLRSQRRYRARRSPQDCWPHLLVRRSAEN